MPKGFKHLLGTNTADRQKTRLNKFRKQGGLRNDDGDADIFANGVQVIMPMTQAGQPLATGSYYYWGNQDVRTFDGALRIIDSSVMKEEMRTVQSPHVNMSVPGTPQRNVPMRVSSPVPFVANINI